MLPPALEFFKRNNYRWLELTASNIAARALRRLDRTEEARAMLSDVLQVAERINDRRQVGLALTGLSGLAANGGSLPEALALGLRAETIHREQQDVAQLPFDLTNRAETLIYMGRLADADTALREIETGIAQKRETYIERQRRVTYLHALAATVTRNYDGASALVSTLEPATDPTGVLLAALRQYLEAHSPKRRGPSKGEVAPAINASASPATQRELHYWVAATHLAARRHADALATATAGLAQQAKAPNDELEWRLAAVGSAAARALGHADEQRALHDRAVAALARLRKNWGEAARDYDARPDLVELRTAAGV